MMNQLDVKPDCIVVNKRRRRPVWDADRAPTQ